MCEDFECFQIKVREGALSTNEAYRYISELKAENERLKAEVKRLGSIIDYIKADTTIKYEENADNDRGEAYDDVLHEFKLIEELTANENR